MSKLTYNEKINYCRGVLENNAFLDFEIPYYKGLIEGKHPHGIDRNIWNVAYYLIRNYWKRNENWDLALRNKK